MPIAFCEPVQPNACANVKLGRLGLAVGLILALGACSGDAERSRSSDDSTGIGSTSNGGSAAMDGQGGSGTPSVGGSVSTDGMGGSVQVNGAGGSAVVDGSGGSSTDGGSAGSLTTGGGAGSATTDGSAGSLALGGSAGSVTTGGSGGEAGGVSTDSETPPIAECVAFCASSSRFCNGPNLEVATSSSVVGTNVGCTLTVELPASGSVEVDLNCVSGEVCIERGSACFGVPGECYAANWGASGFSYFIPGCLNGSLTCSLATP